MIKFPSYIKLTRENEKLKKDNERLDRINKQLFKELCERSTNEKEFYIIKSQ